MNVIKHLELLKVIAEDVEPCGNARLAAMVVYKNKVMSIGANRSKTHPFAAKYSKHPEAIYLHAEAAAILAAKRKLTDQQLAKSTLIVCRVKTGHRNKQVYGLAKPCAGCRQCIEDHGIMKTIYTLDCEPQKVKYVTEFNA